MGKDLMDEPTKIGYLLNALLGSDMDTEATILKLNMPASLDATVRSLQELGAQRSSRRRPQPRRDVMHIERKRTIVMDGARPSKLARRSDWGACTTCERTHPGVCWLKRICRICSQVGAHSGHPRTWDGQCLTPRQDQDQPQPQQRAPRHRQRRRPSVQERANNANPQHGWKAKKSPAGCFLCKGNHAFKDCEKFEVVPRRDAEVSFIAENLEKMSLPAGKSTETTYSRCPRKSQGSDGGKQRRRRDL